MNDVFSVRAIALAPGPDLVELPIGPERGARQVAASSELLFERSYR